LPDHDKIDKVTRLFVSTLTACFAGIEPIPA